MGNYTKFALVTCVSGIPKLDNLYSTNQSQLHILSVKGDFNINVHHTKFLRTTHRQINQ